MRIIRLQNLILAVALAVGIGTAMQLGAQQTTTVTGGLNGAVVDSSAAAVIGAKITITGPQGSRVVTTDSLGHYSISGLIPGFYDVTVEKTGFKAVKSTHNEVVVGGSSLLNLTLTVGNVSETVEVTASAISIDTQSTAIDTNLSDVFYNKVPLPRAVSAIFYAAPGVSGGQVAGVANQTGPGASNPSIGGSSGLENLYVVDGVTVTDQAFGSLGTYNNSYGSLSPGINLAFIKEVVVKSYGFAPQYGKAQGGIVQMVTKSGSTSFHGALGAYAGPGMWYASRKQFYQYGYVQTSPTATLSSPHYDLAAEIGGYFPGLKDKIFFFGAFNPSLDQDIRVANPNFSYRPVIDHGPFAYSQTTLSWAGKLTFNPTAKIQLEISAFGDPSKHNQVPFTLQTTDIPSQLSTYQWGARDTIARLNYTITSSWVADAAYSYNYDHFIETPSLNVYQLRDNTLSDLGTGSRVTTGFGAYTPSREGTYSLMFNTQKTAHWLGEHTLSTGYSYDHTKFLYQPSRSGPFYTIPDKNANGVALNTLFSNIPAKSAGAQTNAIFNIQAANPSIPTDATCALCPVWKGARVYATVYRGTYVGFNVNTYERYHAAYGNDTWTLNRFLTLNAGVRWEEERIAGTLMSYPFTGSWSPRLGINIDPVGDRKGKIFLNWGRNYWAMPLDAANRQLGNEQDDTAYVFAPVIQNGALVVIPDTAHNMNGMNKAKDSTGAVSKFGAPNFSSSTGEGILPGTKAEYMDEWVVGLERELKPGFVFKARYVDRRLNRIIEDVGSQSPEGSSIGSNFNGGIGNPSSKMDIAVNDQELTYTPAQWAAANPNAGQTGWVYKAPVAGCTKSNDTYYSAGGVWVDGQNTPLGGACFLNLATMDAGPGDGKSDGFVDPQRKYQALELEFDKRYSNHWMAVLNYRFANLWGNYEGAYRNDNGQSDPGISSLFDFTAGALKLLGDQFRAGYLSTDRRTVANLFLSYSADKSSPYHLSALKGLTTGLGFRAATGVPLSLLGDHPAYFNQGEVPLGGRGAAGRTPASLQLDMKGEYTLPLGMVREGTVLKLGLDAINVTNSQPITAKVQYTQQPASGYPVVGNTPTLNKDYTLPTNFQGPFYARATIRLEF